jgi:hypothetical protein
VSYFPRNKTGPVRDVQLISKQLPTPQARGQQQQLRHAAAHSSQLSSSRSMQHPARVTAPRCTTHLSPVPLANLQKKSNTAAICCAPRTSYVLRRFGFGKARFGIWPLVLGSLVWLHFEGLLSICSKISKYISLGSLDLGGGPGVQQPSPAPFSSLQRPRMIPML